ncbi:MAG TPA: triose-phosphate isomerase [Thermoplasmatales archaeon]|nr:MAG: triose-phosphate isomerase [Thermoplasmata archaeon]HDM25448.1 triose-phosphate isomerase [Thermoplasmatales archaeon]
MFDTPIIIVNVKTYSEAIGEKAVELAEIMDKLAKETSASLAIAVQHTDIQKVADSVDIPVLAQHIDPISPGSHTGWVLPETVKEAGANGTLINHSEHRLKLADIDTCVRRAEENKLTTVVCSNNIRASKAIAALEPDFVAVEPPELIGGDISVTTANPEIVKGTVEEVRKISKNIGILCGAGVKNGKDVEKAIELGTDGVLLASGVVKAQDKERVLRDLISGLK